MSQGIVTIKNKSDRTSTLPSIHRGNHERTKCRMNRRRVRLTGNLSFPIGDSIMRRFRFVFILLAMFLFAGSIWFASAQTTPGRSFAFLVACGDYDPSELKPVPFTLNEMKLFR